MTKTAELRRTEPEGSTLRKLFETKSGLGAFFSRTLFWTGALSIVPAYAQYLAGPFMEEYWTYPEALYFACSWVGQFLPFAAFAGGLVLGHPPRYRQLLLAAVVVSIGSFSLIGYATPHLRFRAEAAAGLEVDQRYPAGPETINGLLKLRARILESPPEEFRVRTERPLELPPNWVSFLIHARIVNALFAIFAALLGALTANITTGLSPPARRNARWVLGLASGLLFFGAQALPAEWVRMAPSNPAVLGAWAALLIPIAELGLLHFLRVRLRRRTTSPQPSLSDD
jgi:hypothetical protein